MTTLLLGNPAANIRAWISTKEWKTYPNIPSGPAPDPDIPEPEPEPELIIQFNFLYKNEGDAEWREY